MDFFSQRMNVIYDSLSNNETAAALAELNQLTGKKKTADKLTDKQKLMLLLVRSLCMIKMNQYGEANSSFAEFLAGYKEFDSELQQYGRMFIAVAIYLSRQGLIREDEGGQGIPGAVL